MMLSQFSNKQKVLVQDIFEPTFCRGRSSNTDKVDHEIGIGIETLILPADGRK